MGQQVEQPIRDMFDKGYESFGEQLKLNGPWDLFCWMNWIFLKTQFGRTHRTLFFISTPGKVR